MPIFSCRKYYQALDEAFHPSQKPNRLGRSPIEPLWSGVAAALPERTVPVRACRIRNPVCYREPSEEDDECHIDEERKVEDEEEDNEVDEKGEDFELHMDTKSTQRSGVSQSGVCTRSHTRHPQGNSVGFCTHTLSLTPSAPRRPATGNPPSSPQEESEIQMPPSITHAIGPHLTSLEWQVVASSITQPEHFSEGRTTPDELQQRQIQKACVSPIDVAPRAFSNVISNSMHPISIFTMFLPDSIFEEMVQYSNLRAHRIVKNWKDTTIAEQKAFWAIRIYRGLVWVPRVEMYWGEDVRSFANELMTCRRFQQLQRFWGLVSPDREEKDPFDKIRPLERVIKQGMRQTYVPGGRLSLDECMFGSTGRAPGTVYMPDKPHPWGVKVWMVCDAETFITCDFVIYIPPGKQGVKDEGLSEKVALQLLTPYAHTGRQAYMDNFYTGIPLFVKLHYAGIQAIGTVRLNRRGVPNVFSLLDAYEDKRAENSADEKREMEKKKTVKRKTVTRKTLTQKTVTKKKKKTVTKEPATEETVTKKKKNRKRTQGAYVIANPVNSSLPITAIGWQDKVPVVLLSNRVKASDVSTVLRRQKDGNRKLVACPVALRDYNRGMLGVDKHNQLREEYAIPGGDKRWPLCLSSHLINLALTNSWKLYNEFGANELTHYEFLKQVTRQLTLPLLREKGRLC